MIINYAIGLNIVTVWLAFIGFLFSSLVFYISRIKSWFSPAIVFAYTIATILVLGGMHFYNGGSYGPIIYLFIMLLNIYMLITHRAHQIAIYILMSATVLTLLLLEYYMPDMVTHYNSRTERLLDHITSIMYSMFFTTVIIRIFKNTYDKDRALIIQQNNELEEAYVATTQKSEYIESLIMEIHHRVKNNLQVISSLMLLQSQKVEDDSARDALEEGRNRVGAIALVHQMLYMDNELAKVNIQEYLNALSGTIAKSYGYSENNLQAEVLTNDYIMDINIAIPLGLIVNELVYNSFKHAFANIAHPVVRVILDKKNEDTIVLTVSDNGIGINNSDTGMNPASFGMKLVSILVKQLRGVMSIRQKEGTIISVEFKKIIDES